MVTLCTTWLNNQESYVLHMAPIQHYPPIAPVKVCEHIFSLRPCSILKYHQNLLRSHYPRICASSKWFLSVRFPHHKPVCISRPCMPHSVYIYIYICTFLRDLTVTLYLLQFCFSLYCFARYFHCSHSYISDIF